MIDILYCAGGNPLLSEIAYEEGWGLGFRSDKSMGSCKHPVSFIDINYKKPDFEKHLAVVARYHPKYATVPDLSEEKVMSQDIDRAIRQTERLQPHCDTVLIVPKLPGQIVILPQSIAIGYSVPSHYGGAQYPLWELADRRIHLLGGSPRKQMQAYLHLSAIAQVVSLDGNYAHGQAVKFAEYWNGKRWMKHPRVKQGDKDLYQECWRWSCRNLMTAWRKLT